MKTTLAENYSASLPNGNYFSSSSASHERENQVPNSPNSQQRRFKKYFETTQFLSIQDDLSVFIKNFPLIKIQEIYSINTLIQTLIKQNQILAEKCQQNIAKINEMYLKHQKTNHSIKDIKLEYEKHVASNIEAKNEISQLTIENKRLEKQLLQCYENTKNQQKESEEKEIMRIQIKKYSDIVAKISMEYEAYKQITVGIGQSLKELILQSNYKRCIDKINQNKFQIQTFLKNNNDPSSKMEKQTIFPEELKILFLENVFEKYVKDEKRKNKNVQKVKEIISLFCRRLQKIIEITPHEILVQEINKQNDQLMALLNDTLMSLSKNGTKAERSSNNGNKCAYGEGYNLFESLLQKLISSQAQSTLSKNQISEELHSLKEELDASKHYYENVLNQIKNRFETEKNGMQKEILESKDLIHFYQEQQQKHIKETFIFQNQNQETSQRLREQRNTNQILSEKITIYEEKLIKLENGISQLREVYQNQINEVQVKNQNVLRKIQERQLEILNEKDYQICANAQKLQKYKIKLQDFQNLAEQLECSMKQSKFISKKNEEKVFELCEENKSNKKIELQKNKYIESLEGQINQKSKQNNIYQLQIRQLENQKNLQIELTKEVQKKNNELVLKIKSLQTKKSNQKSSKKQLSTLKEVVLEEKKHMRDIEESNKSQKEQNFRLKTIIKEMKKELEEVYVQVNQLKVIEFDRERLVAEMAKSDRVKGDLCKEYEHLKIELMRLQKENNGLALELRHYKNALTRIELLQ